MLGYMWGHPGKKMLFMGGEIGQWSEWNHESSIDWSLLEYDAHRGLKRWVEDLNRFYRDHPPLWEKDFHPDGFRWIDCNDAENSVVAFLRKDGQGEPVAVVCNLTPVPRDNYRIGVPRSGNWIEALNSATGARPWPRPCPATVSTIPGP
jgi:1,4-alpha-glucan branching enzyme